jgi:hypothetical protein
MLIESPPLWRARAAQTGDPDLDKMWQELVDAVAAAVPHAVGQGAEAVMDAAIDAWPVATGKSRQALELTYETTDRTFTAKLDDPVPYAQEIHDGETVAGLLFEPAEEAIPGIVGDLERLITQIGRTR